MKYESQFAVIPSSPLIGMFPKEIEAKFKVKVTILNIPTKFRNVKVYNYATLKAEGQYLEIARLRKFSVGLEKSEGGGERDG